MNLNQLQPVRMTASLAEELFLTSAPIVAVELTERHLDMLQCSAIDLETRALLCDASDDLAAGRLHTAAMRDIVRAFNARCGKRGEEI